MPDTLELPRMRRAVVPLVRRQRLAGFGRGVVNEFIALALGCSIRSRGGFTRRGAGLMPGFAAVIGSLNDLTEPTARL
jgi:hypothetical protein